MLTDSKRVWIGPASEVERILNSVHADLDDNRRFVLDIGTVNLAFLFSNKEVIITSDMSYFMQGARMSLHSLMCATSRIQPKIEFGEDE